MSKRPSLVSEIIYREVQGSSYRFAVMSDIIRGPKAKSQEKENKKTKILIMDDLKGRDEESNLE